MKLVRGLLGGLLWIVAGLVGLVAVVLCVTVILLPLGIPLLMFARRLLGKAIALMLPRAATHPVEELGKSARKKGAKVAGSARGKSTKLATSARKRARTVTPL